MHSHGTHTPTGLGKRLLAGVAINIVITAAQLAGGLAAGSLALVSDALHNMSDVVALSLSYFAYRIGLRQATDRYTFAFRRAEVLAALANSAALIGVSAFIAVEAVRRLQHPEPVSGGLVIAFAAFGMVANAVAALLLRPHDHDLNVRSAVLHLVSDSVASLGVLVGGVLIKVFGWTFVDGIVSLALAAWMVRECISLLRSAAHILMQGVPEDLEMELLVDAMHEIPGVVGTHDVRVWAISSDAIVLSAHVVVDARTSVAGTTETLGAVKRMLHDRFGVEHATLEIECPDGGCAGACGPVALP
jgi:cobalt-zinc-cadmium efflux system protein